MTQECPRCHGSKTLIGMFPVYADHVPRERRKPVIEMKCPTCKGTGTITNDHAKRLAAGEVLRRKRIAAQIGLRESGRLLGIDTMAMPRAQQGEVSLEEIAKVERLLDSYIATRNQPEPTP